AGETSHTARSLGRGCRARRDIGSHAGPCRFWRFEGADSGWRHPPAVCRRVSVGPAREGDPSPESVLAVRTTRAAALHLADPADRIPDSAHTPVYLVVERGHFHSIGLEAIRLPGTRKTPSNLELILSSRNLEVLDYG